MPNLKKAIAASLVGFSVWFPAWPPPGCNVDGPIGSTLFCWPPLPTLAPPVPILPPPRICPLVAQPQIAHPVCGINGITYGNECLLYPIPKWHDGPCFRPTPVPTYVPPPFPTPFVPPTLPPTYPIPTNPVFVPTQPRYGTWCDPNVGICMPMLIPAS